MVWGKVESLKEKGKVKIEKSYGFDALTFQSPRLSEAYQGLVRLSIH